MTIGTLRHALRRWRIGVIRRNRPRNDEAHLLRSPANATRLLAALEGAHKRTGTPVSIEDLRSQVAAR